MDKLTLEHLAPYFPYGLKSYVSFQGHDLIKDIDTHNVMGFVCGDTRSKPILRPLSDMNETFFISFGYAHEEDLQENILSGDIPYNKMVSLLQSHFDVFGLIDAGLAIDINTIKK